MIRSEWSARARARSRSAASRIRRIASPRLSGASRRAHRALPPGAARLVAARRGVRRPSPNAARAPALRPRAAAGPLGCAVAAGAASACAATAGERRVAGVGIRGPRRHRDSVGRSAVRSAGRLGRRSPSCRPRFRRPCHFAALFAVAPAAPSRGHLAVAVDSRPSSRARRARARRLPSAAVVVVPSVAVAALIVDVIAGAG
jgi:hypothetical protein